MAKKNKEKREPADAKSSGAVKEKRSSYHQIKDDTKNGIFAVISFVFALFFMLSAFGKAGIAGNFFFEIFDFLFGIGYYLLPIISILLGISFLRAEQPNIGLWHAISANMILLASLGIIDIIQAGQGGKVGVIASWPFVKLFDVYTSILFLSAILIISLCILFDRRPSLGPVLMKFWNWLKTLFQRHAEELSADAEALADTQTEETVLEVTTEPEEVKAELKPKKKKQKEDKEEEMVMGPGIPMGSYVPPPLTLLEEDRGKPNVGDIKSNSNIIKRTLQNFGIEVEMDEITIGPTVTRYALKPAEGVKLSKIVGLQNDLALALAAHPLRIEAPIPGKSLVGIEIPNKVKSTVGLATLLADDKFTGSPKPLTVALGKAINGKSFFGNLAKMPHVLIAGATGSGKSVTIHTLITSLLYRNGPEQMRFIMIDPKRVELTLYNKIPHLLTPVITAPKQAILSLKWAAKEMDRRYDVLQAEGVRDISSYHENILPKLEKNVKEGETVDKMPYIVVIIDELADIMTSYPRELESGIVRLAQMSRAVGIHLVLSTQRPSVNVITGLIKANVPARIALQVASQIDSRTILDQSGAEKLLGAGDMLYLSGEMSQPERLQSAFITENEVKSVVKYLTGLYKDAVPSEILLSGSIESGKNSFEEDLEGGDDDDMYEDAREAVMAAGKASTSYLQRKLSIGYARAARLIDLLEQRGVVGPGNGAKPREVLEKPMDHINNPEPKNGEYL